MKLYDITTLPQITFAHTHSAQRYSTVFPESHSVIEISCITEGCLEVTRDDQLQLAEKGDILCILRDSPVRVHTDSYHSHHTVCAAVQWIESHSSNALCLPLLTKASAETESISKGIDAFIYTPYLYENTNARAAADFLGILCKIHSINSTGSSLGQTHFLLAERAKKYIHANLHRPIVQNEIAAHLGVTPQHLCQVFRQAEGTTIIKYSNLAKLRKIKALMEKEHLKLYEAAARFGFSDPSYVSSLYHKMFGHSITSQPNESASSPEKHSKN